MAKRTTNLKRGRPRFAHSVIARSAVQEFMTRPLDNWDWLKGVPPLTLHRELKEWKFTSLTPPRGHQMVCTVAGLSNPAFFYMLDMGLGKTWIALNLIRHRVRHRHTTKPWLVVVPGDVQVETWNQEAFLHASDLTVVPLWGTAADRELGLTQRADVYVMNLAGLQVLLTDLIPDPRKKDKRIRAANDDKVRRFATLFDGLVLDEAHNFGNHRSLTYALTRPLSRATRYRYLLSGTPFGRDPMMLWPQFNLMDHGQSLGPTLGLFRAGFFSARENFWGGMEYHFKQRLSPDLTRMMRNASLRYEDIECIDLPPVVRVVERVALPADISVLYHEAQEKLRAAQGNRMELEHQFIRTRQLASGFVSIADGNGERVQLEFPSPKLDLLLEHVKELPTTEKFIVFHEFTPSGDRISKALRSQKIEHVRLYGETKDKPAALRTFLHDPACRGLVANTRTGGSGGNLQVARYLFFYESPVSPIVRQQAEKRCTGARQTRKSFMYDLVVTGTNDERILEFIKEGKDLMQEVCNSKTPG